MALVIDNILPQNYFNELQEYILNSEFPWYLTQYTTSAHDHYASFSWCMVDDSFPASQILKRAYEQILNQLSVDSNCCNLIRLRLALLHRDVQHKINTPHVDHHYKHITALLYLMDSDGDTYLYNEHYDISSNLESYEYMEKVLGGRDQLTVQQTVSPVANRLVVMDGNQYHSSSTPMINQLRIALNINFTTIIPDQQ